MDQFLERDSSPKGNKPLISDNLDQSKTSSETQGQLVGARCSKPDKIVALQFLPGRVCSVLLREGPSHPGVVA